MGKCLPWKSFIVCFCNLSLGQGRGKGRERGGIGPVSSGCRDFHILFHRGWCRTSCLGVFTSLWMNLFVCWGGGCSNAEISALWPRSCGFRNMLIKILIRWTQSSRGASRVAAWSACGEGMIKRVSWFMAWRLALVDGVAKESVEEKKKFEYFRVGFPR